MQVFLSVTASMIERLLSGLQTEFVVSHGRSQYSDKGGASSCGLAALNCARIVLGKERDGLRSAELLQAILQPETFDEVLGLCASWSSAAHLDVEDIYQTPILHRSLSMIRSDYSRTSLSHLKRLLEVLQRTTTASTRSACVVITRPPEIISCFCIATNIFIIFDSHPRPNLHPEGAAFVCYSSLDATATYLAQLLHYDPTILDDDVQWQAQLLDNFSGHVFVSKQVPTSVDYWMDAAIEASLQLLHSRTECLHLKSRNSTLSSDNTRLQRELRKHKGEGSAGWSDSQSTSVSSSAGPSAQRPITSQLKRRVETGPHGTTTVSYRIDSTSRLPASISQSQDVSSMAHSSRTSSTTDRNVVSNKLHSRKASQVNVSSTRSMDTGVISDADIALQLQRLFNEEHLRVLEEREQLKRFPARRFECGVCLEEVLEEFVSEVATCLHRYCRDCIRRHVSSELSSRHFPILCPLCKADRRCREPAVLDDAFVQHLGLSEEQYALFVEMELAAFAIAVNCRSCRNSFLVDKEEFSESNIVTCPIPRCQSSWCKLCSQEVDPDGPEHSCDGFNELHHLMDERGWKYCPGCQTPAEKIDGCNHMSCTSPGCNTHFCYSCGSAIVRSVRGREIEEAVSAHYRRCLMFDEIPEV